MPTKKERREVAARLRDMADSRHCETKNTLVLAGALLAVSGIDAASGTAEDIMRRLADLIEPEPERTCKMVREHDWDDDWEPYGIFCSECDEFVYGWKSDYGYQIPKYCPNCGAKVVEE